jgi:hypothetical protein
VPASKRISHVLNRKEISEARTIFKKKKGQTNIKAGINYPGSFWSNIVIAIYELKTKRDLISVINAKFK